MTAITLVEAQGKTKLTQHWLIKNGNDETGTTRSLTAMNQQLAQNLKETDEIGVVYKGYGQITARIERVKSITPKGYINLESGEQFLPNGYKVGEIDGHYTKLCSVHEAKEIIAANEAKERAKQEQLQQWKTSLEGRREHAIRSAVAAAIKALNEQGWYADVDGIFYGMEGAIEHEIRQFVEAVKPVD